MFSIESNPPPVALSQEQIDEYRRLMPVLASAHTGRGTPFSLLDEAYSFQSPDVGFIEPRPIKATNETQRDRYNLDTLIQIGSLMVPNIVELIDECSNKGGALLDQIDEERSRGKHCLYLGNHPSVDSIIWQIIMFAGARQKLHPDQPDQPETRGILIAESLKRYGLGAETAVDLVSDLCCIGFTAPGTEGGKKLHEDIREYLNARAMSRLALWESSADGQGRELTIAFEGQTGKTKRNPFTKEPLLQIQYTSSHGTQQMSSQPDTISVPFATHQDEDTKKLSIAFGQPRTVANTDEAQALGYEIAYLSHLVSGIHVWQAPSPKMYREVINEKNLTNLINFYHEAVRNVRGFKEDASYQPYIFGPAALR